MKKDFRSMALPFVGVIALVVGSLAGFDKEQIDTLQGSLDGLVTIIATLVSLYGIWKSHDKDEKK